jgi:hypothetical protein
VSGMEERKFTVRKFLRHEHRLGVKKAMFMGSELFEYVANEQTDHFY